MNYEIQEVVNGLKTAREAKGISQRDLGARAGIPQSHLSKIESGKVDLQLSSLIQLARLLDLEVALVPRKALPAVESVVRSTAPQSVSKAAKNIRNRLQEVESVTETLRRALPDNAELNRIATAIRELKHFPLDTGEFERISETLKAYNKIRHTLALSNASQAAIRKLVAQPEFFKQMNAAAHALETLRNRLVHAPNLSSSAPRPAYDLEDDDA